MIETSDFGRHRWHSTGARNMGYVYLTLAAGLFLVGIRQERGTRWFLLFWSAMNLLALGKGVAENDPNIWRFKSGEDRPQWDNYRR
jgi:hypothetical protein